VGNDGGVMDDEARGAWMGAVDCDTTKWAFWMGRKWHRIGGRRRVQMVGWMIRGDIEKDISWRILCRGLAMFV
jgi:hypothetical protein